MAATLSKLWKNRLRNWFLLTKGLFAAKIFTVGHFCAENAHRQTEAHKLISKELFYA